MFGVVCLRQFIDKHVRIIQQDGFTKYGTVKDIDDTFIHIIMDNGRPDSIALDFVRNITEVGGQ